MKKGILASILVATAVSVVLLSGVLARVPQVAPESEGFSSERLARISAVMRAEIDKGTLPGAVTLIARNGRVVHFEAHGYLDSGKTKPMTQDAVFRVFSMTKPFVSVAAMMLVEQGRMKLSDPISTWIPECKDMKVLIEKKDAAGNVTREPVSAERPITVQDLLRHTSGFAYADNAPFPEIKEAYNKTDIESRETDVLGVLLERLTGKRLDLLLDELLFKPLEMKDTGFQVKPEQMARLADAFDADPLKARGWKSARVEADPGKRYRQGGGGAVSTASDYFRFAQMLVNGGALDGARLLSRKTVEYMLSDHIPGFPGAPGGAGYGFGLGFAVRRQEGLAVVPGSTGDAMWSGFGGTSFTIDPKEKIVSVFMAQAPTPRFHTRFLFKNLLYGALVQ